MKQRLAGTKNLPLLGHTENPAQPRYDKQVYVACSTDMVSRAQLW
jgi:hypothetical protein